MVEAKYHAYEEIISRTPTWTQAIEVVDSQVEAPFAAEGKWAGTCTVYEVRVKPYQHRTGELKVLSRFQR